MISGYLIGDRALVANLSALPGRIKPAIDAVVQRLGYALEQRVKANYLRGPRPQHLGIRTGRLAGSITMRFESTPTSATATVGTNVPYGVIWEKTGIPARDVFPVNAKALRFEMNGEIFYRRHVRVPAQAPRPFLKPALADMRTQIVDEIGAALYSVVATTLKAA